MDCIKRAMLQPANKGNWKTGTMIFMTLAMSSDFILIMTGLEKYVFKKTIYTIDFALFTERINDILSYLILFILPCWVINHILIFHNKRYVSLLEKYPYYNGKLFLSFFTISMLLPIVLLLIGFLFFR